MRSTARRFMPTISSLATAYDDQSGSGELVIPETFDGLDDAALGALYTEATETFDALMESAGDDMTPEQLEALAALTEGIEALATETAARETARAERAEAAAALAARVHGTASEEGEELSADTDEDGDSDEESEEDADEEEEDNSSDAGAAETITASGARGRKEARISLSGVRRKTPKAPAAPEAPTMRDVVFASGEGLGVATGTGLDWLGIGKAIDRKLQGYNSTQFANAARIGRHVKEQHSIFSLRREFPEELTISSTDRDHVDKVLTFAAQESRLPEGSLVASGGWCAPSETLYDLIELESRDGMLSIPEVGISRGGITFTPGPSFADLYSQITGFHFTEEDDIAGKYQPGAEGNVEGPKPCYVVECPEFEDHRLEVSGLCIQAGLLMARGFPEVIARTVRGALIAHEHRQNALLIQRIVAGSTAVTMPTPQAGTVAPLLTSIELQVEHYRYTHRLSRGTTLEATFPYWVRGAIRSDLSRRLGVDFLSVTNAQIDAWFRERGINPQFVYNWQAIDTTAAAAFNAWPTSVQFTLYAAGTWIKGASDLITVDTLYDSTLLATNDFTALFTEEGWLVAKRGHDSRVVTVPISADGATHIGIDILHNGTAAPPAAIPGATEDAPLFTSEVAGG